MQALPLLIALLTGTITVIAVVKIADNFITFRECAADNSTDGFIELLQENRQWIERHFICALLGMGVIAYIKYSPALASFDLLARLAAVHVTLSLLFVFVESLFAQRISQELSSRMEPVKVNSRRQDRL